MLVNKMLLKKFIELYGDSMERATGMTTAIALEYIAEAIKNPGKKVVIHHDYNESGKKICDITHQRRKNVINTVKVVISKLDFEHFEFEVVGERYFIRYNPFVEVDI